MLFRSPDPVAAGPVELSGNLYSYAGSAPASGTGSGGMSGAITISLDASSEIFFPAFPGPTSIPPVKLGLYGYSQILAEGGDGNTGGNGAAITIDDIGRRWDGAAYQDVGGGDVNVAVAISSQGGSVPPSSVMLPALGGSGGAVAVTSSSDNVDRAHVVTSTGNIDSSGGNSRELATDPNVSNAGAIISIVYFGVVNIDGILTANGSSDTGITGYGYDGGDIRSGAFIGFGSSSATVTLDADMNADGGFGATTGGDGGSVGASALGLIVVSNGALNARGGNSNVNVGTGGTGGTAFHSGLGLDCTNNGTVDVSGGSGNTPGTTGTDSTC